MSELHRKKEMNRMMISGLESGAATALRRMARNETIKSYVQQNAPLYDALLPAALRFIGGETLPRCLTTVRTVNEEGFATGMDFMGESTCDSAAARQAAEEFLCVVKSIKEYNLNSSIGLGLSHIGMAIDASLAFENASAIAQAAHEAGTEIMINAEGSERTNDVFDLHRRLCERHDNVGITIQAYLYRSAEDLVSALNRPAKIRLVKGTYGEPPEAARQCREAVDSAYREFMETLLASGHTCSIATHDRLLLDHAHKFIQELNLNKDAIEFEMLYGVAMDRLREMLCQGYRTRVYVPYGKEWYLYLCHRLAEYPPNIHRAISDAVGKFDLLMKTNATMKAWFH